MPSSYATRANNEKEKEIIRSSVLKWLGKSGPELILCAHATKPDSFTKDPLLPDDMKISGYARKINKIASAPADSGDVVKTETKNAVKLVYGEHTVSMGKDMFDRIKRIHKKYAKKTANILEDMWRATYRYGALGMFSGMSASLPPEIYRKLRVLEPRATECFASFFNHTLDGGYRGLFPDVESNFGCRGSFFKMTKPLPMMLCNPPFDRCVMNAFVDHILHLLGTGTGSAVVVLPAFDVNHRKELNESNKCKTKYPTDYETDVNIEKLKVSTYTKWYGMYCKEHFPYLEMASGRFIYYTSTIVLYMSSYKKQKKETVEKIIRIFPRPDISM